MNAYSIYIHLPYCDAKCPYCDFPSSAVSERRFAEYRQALTAEWEAVQSSYRQTRPISIYVGGGTPSIWPERELISLLFALPISDACEVTVEVNPGSVTPAWLECIKTAGVNRISVGVQAMDDRRLALLGRRHTAGEAGNAISVCNTQNFGSISADIIYGTPGQTPDDLKTELQLLTGMGVHHISAYELTVSHHTPIGKRVCEGTFNLPSESTLIALWHTVRNLLSTVGIGQYEVSNYARPGHESRHNRHYWTGGEYIGLGSGAHGYVRISDSHCRYANTTDIDAYIDYWTKKDATQNHLENPLRTVEYLSLSDLALERVMLGLRTTKGFDFNELLEMIPKSKQERWREIATTAASRGLVLFDGAYITPTADGLLLADAIAEEFF